MPNTRIGSSQPAPAPKPAEKNEVAPAVESSVIAPRPRQSSKGDTHLQRLADANEPVSLQHPRGERAAAGSGIPMSKRLKGRVSEHLDKSSAQKHYALANALLLQSADKAARSTLRLDGKPVDRSQLIALLSEAWTLASNKEDRAQIRKAMKQAATSTPLNPLRVGEARAALQLAAGLLAPAPGTIPAPPKPPSEQGPPPPRYVPAPPENKAPAPAAPPGYLRASLEPEAGPPPLGYIPPRPPAGPALRQVLSMRDANAQHPDPSQPAFPGKIARSDLLDLLSFAQRGYAYDNERDILAKAIDSVERGGAGITVGELRAVLQVAELLVSRLYQAEHELAALPAADQHALNRWGIQAEAARQEGEARRLTQRSERAEEAQAASAEDDAPTGTFVRVDAEPTGTFVDHAAGAQSNRWDAIDPARLLNSQEFARERHGLHPVQYLLTHPDAKKKQDFMLPHEYEQWGKRALGELPAGLINQILVAASPPAMPEPMKDEVQRHLGACSLHDHYLYARESAKQLEEAGSMKEQERPRLIALLAVGMTVSDTQHRELVSRALDEAASEGPAAGASSVMSDALQYLCEVLAPVMHAGTSPGVDPANP